MCSSFLRTCISFNIVDILSTKSSPIEQTLSLLFYRTLVTPPPLEIFLLKKGKIFIFRWDRTHNSYVPSNSDLKYLSLTTKPILVVSNSTLNSLKVQGSGCGPRNIFLRRLHFVFSSGYLKGC